MLGISSVCERSPGNLLSLGPKLDSSLRGISIYFPLAEKVAQLLGPIGDVLFILISLIIYIIFILQESSRGDLDFCHGI